MIWWLKGGVGIRMVSVLEWEICPSEDGVVIEVVIKMARAQEWDM